ncbi:MAG: hypothetical protein JO199_05710 [Candidatus Eremiobacteraeota bacterium]|nr:hypothetical protein [Candidatus Eremiobacteraeota bacterium]
MAALCLVDPASAVAAPNALNSTVNDALIARVATLLAGEVPKAGSGLLRDECAGAEEWFQGRPDDRVLVSDVLLSGPAAAKVALNWEFGTACRVSVKSSTSRELKIEANAEFRDFWSVFRVVNSVRAPWILADGQTVSVWTMRKTFLVSAAEWHGDRVIAMPFRDNRFAIIIVAGANVTSAASSYFDSIAFLNREGFRPEQITLSLPRLKLSSTNTFRTAGAKPVAVSQRLTFSLNENGAGDAPLLPRTIGKVNNPNTGLVYVKLKYKDRVRVATLAIDRPFYFAIVDTATQARLIEGFVSDPRSN